MNKQRIHFLFWPLLVILSTLVIEYLIFGTIVLHPNSRLIMDNQDGRQIYFNILYHVKYGSGFTLSNQNYPFYECIFMTDAQAMLAYVLNWIQHHFFSIEDYVVGIINGLIFYTIPLCSLFLFLIFRNLQIRHWLAAIFSVILCFLSPQMFRITAGHYGLSYLFYFPMLIYFLFRIMDQAKIRWYVFIVILVMIMGLNNGHLSFAGSMLLLVFGLMAAMYSRKRFLYKGLSIFMIGMVCMLCFYVIIRHYDTLTDRESIPWGFLYYYTQFESVFVPFAGKVLAFYQSLWPVKIAEAKEEGIAYIGIAGCLFTLFLLFKMMYFLVRKKFRRLLRVTLNAKVNILLISGFLILLYAMAFPFRFGMEDTLEHIPFIRQFRSPGRFAWMFYYAFGIYLVYTLQLIIRSARCRRHPAFSYSLVLLLLVFYLQDIADYTTWYKRYLGDMRYFENVFVGKKEVLNLLSAHHIDRAHFSSIYGIPVCNQWNSKFGREDDQYPLVTPMLNISYNTGIPWMNSKLSRVSTSQTMATGQFVSSPLIHREIEPLIDQHKKILLICKKDYQPLPSEQYVIDHARKLFEDSLFTYFSFSFEPLFYALRDSLSKHFEKTFLQQRQHSDSLQTKGCLLWKYTVANKNDFAVSDKTHDKLILDTVITRCGHDSLYEFSIWSRVDHKTDGAPYIKIVRSTSHDEIIDSTFLHSARAIDIQQGMLRLCSVYKQTQAAEKIKVYILKGKNHCFERLLIRPLSYDFYTYSARRRIFNNYIIE